MPTGHTWQTAYAQGLQSARFSCDFMVRTLATEVLAQTFWDMWLARTFSGGFDDTSNLTLVSSDGTTLATSTNAKAEAFSLSWQKGQQIGLQGVFLAPAHPTMSSVTPNAYNHFDGSAPLMFDQGNITGITGEIYGFELGFANNHVANAPLGASYGKGMKSWDAGVQTVTCRITVNKRANAVVPFTVGGSIALALTNGVVTRTLTLARVIPDDRLSQRTDPGAIFKTYNCLVLGSDTTAPLVVS